jgi:hypothetical protein
MRGSVLQLCKPTHVEGVLAFTDQSNFISIILNVWLLIDQSNFISIILNVWLLIRSTKYTLIIKLIIIIV